ncbi:Holliday junction branch migration protein RuvA, partial [Mycoplasmopsis pullorum]
MILYRLGEILYKNGANVVFESQGIGYSIQVPDHERLEINQK